MNEIYRKFWLIVFTRYLWQGHAFAYQQGYSSIHHHISYKGHTLYSTLHTSHAFHPRLYKSKSLLLSHEDSSVDGNIHNNNDNVDMKPSFLKRIRNKLGGTASDGLTTSQQLAKMGLSALLSYGFVSNMSLCVTVSLAWFSFNKKYAMSPLAPGQWKGFLAWYAGFYVFSNFMRPIRVAVSVAISPYFENSINYIQSKTNISRPLAITLVVFLANVCGTVSFMSGGIVLASYLSGIPVFPPKL